MVSSRKLVHQTIEFGCPERIPVMYNITRGAWICYGKQLEKVFSKYPSDFAGQSGRYQPSTLEEGTCEDEWHCVLKRSRHGLELGITHAMPQRPYPLKDWEELKSYIFPDTSDWNYSGLKRLAHENKEEKYLCASIGRLFERMQWLRGFENLLVDICKGRKEVEVLRDKIIEVHMKKSEKILECGVDGLYFFDDWGTQSGLMINPEKWRKIFKPAYEKIINLVHQAGKHFLFHSCGHILEIIPDLIEIGIDVLNPQLTGMNLEYRLQLSSLCKDKICIICDIDAHILAQGSVEEVKQYVKQTIEMFGSRSGGLIARGRIMPDSSLQNVETMLRGFKEYKCVS